MNRTTLSLIAVATALAAVTGFAAVSAPDPVDSTATAKAPARLPVERSSLLCPAPSTSELAETVYTSFTPAGTTGAGTGGAAELAPSAAPLTDTDPADDEKKTDEDKAKDDEAKDDEAKAPAADGADAKVKPFLALKEPGKPVSGTKKGADAPALVGAATGPLAPGWTAQQTTTVTAGDSRGLLGMTCTAPAPTSGSPERPRTSRARTTSTSPTPTTRRPSPTSRCSARKAPSSPIRGRAFRSRRAPASRSCCRPSPERPSRTSPSMSAPVRAAWAPW